MTAGRDEWYPARQAGVREVVSAGAPASRGVRGQLGREPAGRADDGPERPAPAHRHRTVRSGSSRTMPHLARSCGSPGAQWLPRARWRAAMVSCHSSRYARTGRTGAGETTSPHWPRTRRSRSRWAARLGRLLAMCSCGLPSSPGPAPHRHDQDRHRLDTDPGRLLASRGASVGQHPPRAWEVAGVAVRVAHQVVLVLRLGLPERTGWGDLGDHLAGPEPGGVDVGDGVLGNPALLLIEVEDRRAVAHADVIPLAVQGRRVVDLEEELQQLAVGGHLRVEDDLDRLGVGPVVAVGGVCDVASRVAHPRRQDPWAPPDQVLHPPETPSGQDRRLPLLTHRFAPSVVAGWLRRFRYAPSP